MLKNKGPKQIEINSEDLFKISIKILKNYYFEPNIYSFMLLCYLTVKDFSRNSSHLDKNAKIELCIKYAPDLIDGLHQLKFIDDSAYKLIKNQLDNSDLPQLLNVYITIYYNNDDTAMKKTKCCLGI